ncbi:rRNA methyltransferase [Spiroplasma sp. NBRC 100390]|uniref:TlyA family RNA methyltransferase n=1 Tax=unclassified Spiroplasma TaxID=2637901 RepID=UPI0008927D38|nr:MULTISPECIES: TlyA family RNA methyltransferase [unclassified Spiroplasma]AOX43877.1 rRNA methyltransferase [Spiroplasma sp. TU-14]APE13347.1 rRNA methyltransferase [Spiroplasma sp. NBRC 100390]
MKTRLDQLLVNHNLAPSREKAKAMILANNVLVNNVPALKAGDLVDVDSIITLRGEPLKYVSRAGEKLAKGLETFQIKVDNLICLDIGSSTGGFTDCLLQNNAKKVYALDVGTNQLAWKLRNNPQVISLEKTNFRYVTKQLFEPDQIEFACCDVSFISLDKIIPPLKEILLLDHYAFFLIKPQFESTRATVNKGKINSKEAHQIVIKKVINLALTNGFSIINLDYSPILGNKKKNIEFICLLQRTITPINHLSDLKIIEIIENAWNSLLS